MKTILILCIILSTHVLSFAQYFQITSKGVRNANNSEDYSVQLKFDSVKAAKLYLKTCSFLEGTGDIIEKQENDHIKMRCKHESAFVYYKGKQPVYANYTIYLQFKDGAITISFPEIVFVLESYTYDKPILWKGGCGFVFCVFQDNGIDECRSGQGKDGHFKERMEHFLNTKIKNIGLVNQ